MEDEVIKVGKSVMSIRCYPSSITSTGHQKGQEVVVDQLINYIPTHPHGCLQGCLLAVFVVQIFHNFPRLRASFNLGQLRVLFHPSGSTNTLSSLLRNTCTLWEIE